LWENLDPPSKNNDCLPSFSAFQKTISVPFESPPTAQNIDERSGFLIAKPALREYFYLRHTLGTLKF
jgi:hypothetical protein